MAEALFLTDKVNNLVSEAKDLLTKINPNITEAPSAMVKISKGGTAITKSTIEGFTDCVPLRDFNIPMMVTPPNPNASGGMSGGGSFQLEFITTSVDKNADIGDTAQCFFTQDDMDVSIIELSKTDGGFAVQMGYEFKNCKLINLPTSFENYRILTFRVQSIKFLENAFGIDGKKTGVKATGEFDAAKGK